MTFERPMSSSDAEVADRLAIVREAVHSLGSDNVTIVAVTKGFDRSAMDCADGIGPSELDDMLLVAADLDIDVVGLMTIGVLGDREATNAAFIELDGLCASYELAERSMGMSGDYRDALAAGATMLRLGSTLFGDRPPR